MGVIYAKEIIREIIIKGAEISADFAIKKANERIKGTKIAEIISLDDPPEGATLPSLKSQDEIVEDFVFGEDFSHFLNSTTGKRRLAELGYNIADNADSVSLLADNPCNDTINTDSLGAVEADEVENSVGTKRRGGKE